MATKKNTEVILVGDLNINYLNNTDHREVKGISPLRDLTQCTPYIIYIHHNSSNLIDVNFWKETSRIAKSEVILMPISDHDMISWVDKMSNIKFNGRIICYGDYRNYNPEHLQKDIRESNLCQIESIKSVVNDPPCFLKSTLTEIFQKHASEFDKKVRG